jgi:hypothetical protein
MLSSYTKITNKHKTFVGAAVKALQTSSPVETPNDDTYKDYKFILTEVGAGEGAGEGAAVGAGEGSAVGACLQAS